MRFIDQHDGNGGAIADRASTDRANVLDSLHRLKVAGNAALDDEIAEALLPLLTSRLKRRWPRADLDKLTTAVHDTVMWYLAHSNRYDGTSARLDVFLGHVAHRRLQDSYRRDRLRATHEVCMDLAQVPLAAVSHERVGNCSNGPDRSAIRLRLISLARTEVERRFINAYLETDDPVSSAMILSSAEASGATGASVLHRLMMRFRQRATRSRHRNSRRNVSTSQSVNE